MIRYTAKLFQNDIVEDGLLKIEDEKLIFFNEKTELSIHKSEIIVEKESNSSYFFSKFGDSSFKIFTAEYSILRDNFFKSNQEKSTKKIELKQQKKWATVFLLILFGLIFTFFGIIFLNRKSIVDKISQSIPKSTEEKLGQGYIFQMKNSDQLDTNKSLNDTLASKVALLLLSINKEYDIKTYISTSEDINAYALPGGHLVFNKGLLQSAHSWEEVLGVAAHEIAHITQRHHIRGVLSKFGLFTLVSMVFGDGGAVSELILTSGAKLDELAYSREFEVEADKKGFEYLSNASINPEGMRLFFTKLKDLESNTSLPEFLNTHPDTSNRIEAIKKLEATLKNQKFIILNDYQLFKSNL
ncbi:MAG: hypothetical protein RLZZ546_1037 [Bacteroidota bacterium]